MKAGPDRSEESTELPTQTNAGLGQLTLAEHSLCPLYSGLSLRPNMVHESEFFYMHPVHGVSRARARVTAPGGLSAGDELFLWGLLALTLAQPDADGELCATRHYCLRHFGLIDQNSRRGGRQYRQFNQAIDRLAVVSYQSDAFYDPIRREYRKATFRFFSYSRPQDDDSTRAWRFIWDPLFLELVQPNGGHLWFDMETYRQLDPASRRLFLLLSKIFCRRSTTPRFGMRNLAVDVLGFSPDVSDRDLKRKLTRCVSRLIDANVVAADGAEFGRIRSRQTLRLHRARRYQARREYRQLTPEESALGQSLKEVGFEPPAIRRLISGYPMAFLRLWADVTLAAIEHKGKRFFTNCPQAWFMDNVKHAAAGVRTPPDWFLRLQKAEVCPPRTRTRRGLERAIDPAIVNDDEQGLLGFVQSQISNVRRA